MKQLIFTLLAAAALASCAQNELEGPDGGRKGEIQVTAGVDGARTKAYMNKATGLAGASFIVKEGISEPTNDFSGGTAYSGDVEATSGKVKFVTAPKYNSNNANAYLVAYFPGKTLTGNTVEWDIDGKTDIMLTNAIWNAGKYSAPVTTGLNFNHQLARVEVVLKAEAGSSLDAVRKAWGNVEKIEFLGAPEKMKYDLSGKPAVTTSGTADFALLADYDGVAFTSAAIPANDNLAANAMAMLAPVTPTATESFILKVTTAGDGSTPIEMTVSVNLEDKLSRLAEGYTHIVTMTFKANIRKIEVKTTTVDEWRDGTKNDFDLDMPVITPPAKISVNGTELAAITYNGSFNGTDYKVPASTDASYNNTPIGTYFTDIAALLKAEPPFQSFEVSATDEGSIMWLSGLDACTTKSPSGQWRMPRLSELMLIYLNKDALEAIPGFATFSSSPYWSASERDNNYCWYISFPSGYLDKGGPKGNGSNVRCIRELSDTPAPAEPSVGDYYFTDGTFATALDAGKTPAGVVYWVDDAVKTHFRVCSIDKTTNIVYSRVAEVTDATDKWDGKANHEKIKRMSDWQNQYPAFAWCAAKTEGGADWYLPAQHELQYLYCAVVGVAYTTWGYDVGTETPPLNQTAWDSWNALFTATGADNAFAKEILYSSTETYNSSAAFELFGGYNESPDKRTPHHIRCIKEFGRP